MVKKDAPLLDDFDVANAAALAEMLVDEQTSQKVQLMIINDILEASKNLTFFEKMFNEEMSLAKCPFCSHLNHFLIPEDDLNQFGWVSYEHDERVLQHTSVDTCPDYAEACAKKKTVA